MTEGSQTAEDYYRLWSECFDRGDYENSIPFMKKAIRLDPAYEDKIRARIDRSVEDELVHISFAGGNATAEDHYRIWCEYFDRGDYENSVPFMKKAIELDPAYEDKIRAYIDRSVENELVHISVAEGKATADDYFMLWREYFDRGDYESSMPFMKKAVQLDPAYEDKIRAYIDRSVEDELIRISASEGKSTAEDYFNMWRECFDRGDYENSIPFMKKATQLDPAYGDKIRAYIDRSVESEIIRVSVAEGKATADDYFMLWREYFDRGDYESSMPFMKKAVELDPSYTEKFRSYLESVEAETLIQIEEERERVREEVLERERARELITMQRGTGDVDLGKMRPLKFGPLTLRPSISYQFKWDDNIFLTPDDRRADYVSTVTPSFGGNLDLPFALPFIVSAGGVTLESESRVPEHTLFNLEYKPIIKTFLEHPKESNVGHSFITTSVIPSNLFGGRGKLVFGFKDILLFTTDPATNEDVKFTPRYNNEMEFKAKYTPAEKISMAFAYLNILEWYKPESRQEFSYSQHVLTPTLYYNMTSKSTLFMDADFGKVAYYTGNRNSTFLQISGGITGKITPKTDVYLKAGYQFRAYENKNIYGDYNSLTMTGSMSSMLRKDVVMKLMLGKSIVESTYQDNAYFDLKYAELELVKHISGKTSLLIGGSLGKNDYPRNSEEDEGVRTRRDYVWGLKGGLSYRITRWLDSSLAYEYKGRDSNFKRYYYRDNRLLVNLRASY
ncbi:MAG: outer membrane beta-barrel protein [Candidatus Omnitrophota bacterium]